MQFFPVVCFFFFFLIFHHFAIFMIFFSIFFFYRYFFLSISSIPGNVIGVKVICFSTYRYLLINKIVV